MPHGPLGSSEISVLWFLPCCITPCFLLHPDYANVWVWSGAAADPQNGQLPPVEALKQEIRNVEGQAADDAKYHNNLMEQANVAIMQADGHKQAKQAARRQVRLVLDHPKTNSF
jgi:hypothetical protein